MSRRNQIAFGCYLAAIAALGIWGFVYALRSELLPYHVVALGMPLADVPPPFQVLIFTLYKLVGGAWVVIALALLAMLLGPFRQGTPWARRTIPVILLLQAAGIMHAMAHITLHSPATPPWAFTIAVVVLTVVGFLLARGQPGNPQ